jgi:uncharacterized protein with NRDE domain
MCLILVAWKVHADYPCVVAANRDEFHERPASAAGYWPDHPEILAGRDLQAKGTWLGVSRSGRFASITNYRGGRDPSAPESRGALVSRFLLNGASPRKYLASLNPAAYSGFNLFLADDDELWWLSNRGDGAKQLAPGYYALGNFLLDSPDVQEIKERFRQVPVAVEPLFALLASAKIVAPAYGTRCSTVVIRGNGGRVQFAERPFDAAGADGSTLRYELGGSA